MAVDIDNFSTDFNRVVDIATVELENIDFCNKAAAISIPNFQQKQYINTNRFIMAIVTH